MGKNNKEKVTEITKLKPRVEEEKFFTLLSGTQLTAILLIILASTFLVQGVISYLEAVDKLEFLRPWFLLILCSLILLTTSVVSTTTSAIISPLKLKRTMNLISFHTFLFGFVLFLISLLYLLMII